VTENSPNQNRATLQREVLGFLRFNENKRGDVMRKLKWFSILLLLLFLGCVTTPIAPDAVDLGV
jgi:hypothetical protein